MKIYKYAPMDKALEILKSSRLLLNNPQEFNDPFDSNLKRDKKDEARVRKIMESFTMATLSVGLLTDPSISQRVKKSPLFKTIKANHTVMVKSLRAYPRYKDDIGMRSLYKALCIKNATFKKQIELNLKKFENITSKSIEDTRKDTLVTCFSKRCDSILMWSHYSKSHTGVCIEYDRPNNNDFWDIIYSRKRPKIKLEELISFMCALSIIGEQFNHLLDTELMFKTTSPYLTKSIDWKYEQEVRCLAMRSMQSENHIIENDKHYYRMPKPTKIYIGCKAKGKEMNDLISFAKKNGIKCVFLKCDDETFSLKEK